MNILLSQYQERLTYELGLAIDIPKDVTKPDGEACREDGTLKDAEEIEWMNSPSKDIGAPLLKRRGSRSEDEAAARKKACVSYVTEIITQSHHLLA